jgi:hypothetical protein
MLFAISLAQKLGMKYNLQAFSLHPGVIWTNLGNHLDWNVEFGELRKTGIPLIFPQISVY